MPKAGVAFRTAIFPKFHLPGGDASPPPQNSRNPLLENLHHDGRITGIRFADLQVKVLGHHDVPEQGKIVAIANFTQNFQELIACPLCAQERQPPVATASDEMQMAQSVAAFQAVLHQLYPRALCNTRKELRHPHILAEPLANIGVISSRCSFIN